MTNELGFFYINSYPRSGNTWVRSVLNDILKPQNTHVNPEFYKFFRILNFHRLPKLKLDRLRPSMTMIKSHGRYETINDNLPAVYLVRDGRDAIISYYHFNVDHRRYVETFDQYFRRHVVDDAMNSYRERILRKFMGDWSDNALSYKDKKNVLILRYEDLVLNPVSLFDTMLKFIGANVELQEIKDALQSGEARLKEKKARHDRPRGVSGGWKNFLTQEQQELFIKRHGKALKVFKYI